MSYGPKQVFTVGIASGASTSSYIDFGDKAYTKMAINVVTMSTGALINILGSQTATGTYLPVMERVNTAPVQHQALTIATSTSGNWVMFDAIPLRYMEFITSAVVSGGVSFTVVIQD